MGKHRSFQRMRRGTDQEDIGFGAQSPGKKPDAFHVRIRCCPVCYRVTARAGQGVAADCPIDPRGINNLEEPK